MTARILCRLLGHKIDWTSINLAGHQSYRMGRCARGCEGQWQQHLSYYGNPPGPWRAYITPSCTHGVDGANLGRHNCMSCLNEHSARGLR
jgi:hypothetical protein